VTQTDTWAACGVSVASMTWGKFDVHVCKTFFSRPFSQTSVHFLYRGYSFRCFLWKQALVGSAYGRRSYRKEQHILTPPNFFPFQFVFPPTCRWTERAVTGKIRVMYLSGCLRKFDVAGFVDRFPQARSNCIKAGGDPIPPKKGSSKKGTKVKGVATKNK